ncbi:hypothetical protein RCL1_000013 [Eukaryota sp. TZLM3-RCL]
MKNSLSNLANNFHPGNICLKVDQFLGESQLDAKTFMHVYAVKTEKEIFCSQSDSYRLDFDCSDVKCKFHVHSTTSNGTKMFIVRTFRDHCDHCEALQKDRVPEPALGRLLSDLLRDEKKLSPTTIFNDLDKQMSISSVSRACMKAQELFLGTLKSSYSFVLPYIEKWIENNPGTVGIVDVDCSFFKHCFVALGASINGFNFTKKVIALDGTHLKTSFKGVLLIAVSVDAGGHIFPLCYGVYASESKYAWTQFLQHLKEHFKIDSHVFISDRQKGLIPALAEQFPANNHYNCVHHLVDNFKSRGGKGSGEAVSHLWTAARTPIVQHVLTIPFWCLITCCIRKTLALESFILL